MLPRRCPPPAPKKHLRQNSPVCLSSLGAVEDSFLSPSSPAPVQKAAAGTGYQPAKEECNANINTRTHTMHSYVVNGAKKASLFSDTLISQAVLPNLVPIAQNVPSTSEMSSITCLASCSKRRSLDKHISYSPFSTSNYTRRAAKQQQQRQQQQHGDILQKHRVMGGF